MASRSRICSGENSRAGRSLVYSWECNMERCFCQWIGTGCNITVTLEGICYRDVSACLRRRGGLYRPGGHRLNCGDKRGLRNPRPSRGRHSAKPNDWPGGTSATLLLFVRTKSNQKGASPQGLDPLRFTGDSRTRSASEELRCPVNG